ncbi:uncharacterized protein LOC118745527 [Rhagoletis pomonella]|uniref:uncharacterized protein LOC118745527 n=1 Tax=Rhagoletis pomonella TaxID=28610 RepID=UPI00177D27F2|nr:uncharacterized protein LOC118745527 [Rhagoletis pomonella]
MLFENCQCDANMPITSEKGELLNGLCFQNALDLLMNDSSDDENEEDIMLAFTINVVETLTNRRATHFYVPKTQDWTQSVLGQFDSNRCRQMLRVEIEEFSYILSLIKDDKVFSNKNGVPQLSIERQLQIALFRLGSSGESASVRKIATLFGFGDGGTLNIVTYRVIKALINLKHKFLFWPSETERKAIAAKTMHELPGCIGYVDGSEIRLAEAPVKNHELYFSRKSSIPLKCKSFAILICKFIKQAWATEAVFTMPRYTASHLFAKIQQGTFRRNSGWMVILLIQLVPT